MLGFLYKISKGNSAGPSAKGSNTAVCFRTRQRVIPRQGIEIEIDKMVKAILAALILGIY